MSNRHWTKEERAGYGCRVCSECQGYSHHWIEHCREAEWGMYTHVCKHCDMTGMECEDCDGDGCVNCDNEGVKEQRTWCPDCENVLCTCDDEEDWND